MWLVHNATDISSVIATSPPLSIAPARRRSRGGRSLGSELERDRLEKRARRVRQVIDALRERADAREGGAPRPLTAAIEDFGRELADLERRLRHTGGR
jgi:hypothetical protein